MERMKLLIAEGTEEFRMALMDALRGVYRVRACGNGQETLEAVRQFKPDLMILDLMLPGLDGITLLQRSVEAGYRPMVLATTSYQNEYVLDSLQKLGVGYVMVKPCDLRATVARLADLSQRITAPAVAQPDIQVHVTNLLLAMGFKTSHNGYSYLRRAIVQMSGDLRQSITKELYPLVAREFQTNKKSVEHCIRTAIEKAWESGDRRLWRMYFDQDMDNCRRPSNGDFICRLAELVSKPSEK